MSRSPDDQRFRGFLFGAAFVAVAWLGYERIGAVSFGIKSELGLGSWVVPASLILWFALMTHLLQRGVTGESYVDAALPKRRSGITDMTGWALVAFTLLCAANWS